MTFVSVKCWGTGCLALIHQDQETEDPDLWRDLDGSPHYCPPSSAKNPRPAELPRAAVLADMTAYRTAKEARKRTAARASSLGYTHEAIARRMGVSESTVERWISQYLSQSQPTT